MKEKIKDNIVDLLLDGVKEKGISVTGLKKAEIIEKLAA